MIRVFLADDHPVVLNGVKSMFAGEPDIVVAETALSAAELTEKLASGGVYDVLLLDLNFADGDGVVLCRQFSQNYPSLRILAFTNIEEIAIVRNMLKNGARGYFLKSVSREELLHGIRSVMSSGDIFLQSYLQKKLLDNTLGVKPSAGYIPRLTTREKDILSCIVEGLTTQEMADRLFVSVSTVETHRLNLMQKFGVPNMAALVREAILKGLV
ncbi:MAG: response regulator transcription factor [Bacteroidia bacterium]|nr:response regulator transcription factor [Bacteroidia bacterium]